MRPSSKLLGPTLVSHLLKPRVALSRCGQQLSLEASHGGHQPSLWCLLRAARQSKMRDRSNWPTVSCVKFLHQLPEGLCAGERRKGSTPARCRHFSSSAPALDESIIEINGENFICRRDCVQAKQPEGVGGASRQRPMEQFLPSEARGFSPADNER